MAKTNKNEWFCKKKNISFFISISLIVPVYSYIEGSGSGTGWTWTSIKGSGSACARTRTPNLRSGLGSNQVRTVREPDRGQFNYHWWVLAHCYQWAVSDGNNMATGSRNGTYIFVNSNADARKYLPTDNVSWAPTWSWTHFCTPSHRSSCLLSVDSDRGVKMNDSLGLQLECVEEKQGKRIFFYVSSSWGTFSRWDEVRHVIPFSIWPNVWQRHHHGRCRKVWRYLKSLHKNDSYK